jgi:hypothetical protein
MVATLIIFKLQHQHVVRFVFLQPSEAREGSWPLARTFYSWQIWTTTNREKVLYYTDFYLIELNVPNLRSRKRAKAGAARNI